MDMPTINYWAVLVAALAYMVVGALWYSQVLFGKSWMKGIGKTKEQIDADFSPLNFLWTLILSIIAAYGIARVLMWQGGATITDGVLVSLLVGVCFVFPAMATNDVFEARPRSLSMINILYHLASFVVIGIIIAAWR